MLFNSIQFAIFLPFVFVLYWILPDKCKTPILLISSYFFYMSWNYKYIILIIAITFICYISAILIEDTRNDTIRKWIRGFSIASCLGVLIIFKYLNFFLDTAISILSIFSQSIDSMVLDIVLPVGISFYTFQGMSYIFDVYNKTEKAERSLIVFATYLSFFPQLVAGPIERTRNLLPQIKSEKTFDYDKAMYGARQMLWGFFKKIAVADFISVSVDNAYLNVRGCTSFDSFIVIVLFTMQIYCDFSGYSDIAIGVAKLFGIDLMSNFNSPYLSLSIREFWSRWHISLSTWFKDYIYIPLGGSKCSKMRKNFNVLVTFAVSGLWHGAAWTYVIWGILHGISRIAENILAYLPKKIRVPKIIRWFIVFGIVNVLWVFFRADSIDDSMYVICNAFKLFCGHFSLKSNIGLTSKRLIFGGFTIICVMIYDFFSLKIDIIKLASYKSRFLVQGIEYAVLATIILAMIFGVENNPFVYFQF